MLLKRLLAYILFFVAIQTLAAQNAIVYKDASEFPFYGRIHNEQNNLYGRLPLSFEEVSRSSVWRLGRNSAGIAVRFRTNSTSVHVKWESLLKRSLDIGADYIATGHYAQIEQLPNGRYSLKKSANVSAKSF